MYNKIFMYIDNMAIYINEHPYQYYNNHQFSMASKQASPVPHQPEMLTIDVIDVIRLE